MSENDRAAKAARAKAMVRLLTLQSQYESNSGIGYTAQKEAAEESSRVWRAHI
jgi:hypothetical protein